MRKFISRGIAMIAVMLAVLVAGLGGAGTASAEVGIQRILNWGSIDGCMDLTSYASGTPVSLATCNSGASQWWNIPGDRTIRSNVSGLCMDVSSYNTGAVVHMKPCHGGRSQQWMHHGDFTLYPIDSVFMCMDLRSFTVRTPVTLAPCSSVSSQQWVFY